MVNYALIVTAEYVGKVDPFDVSSQVKMELLISGIPDTTRFRDKAGTFLDIKEWTGVSLDEDGDVISIRWASMFSRIFPKGGKIDLKWIPRTVERIEISGDNLEGVFNASDFTDSMVSLAIVKNQIRGSIHFGHLPRKLTILRLDMNELQGSIDLRGIQSPLWSIALCNNLLEGSVDLTSLKDPLNSLFIANNQLSGSVDLSMLPQSLTQLQLMGNKLCGTLQLVNLPKSLFMIDASRNDFSAAIICGPFSENFSVLNLQDNPLDLVIDADGALFKDSRVEI